MNPAPRWFRIIAGTAGSGRGQRLGAYMAALRRAFVVSLALLTLVVLLPAPRALAAPPHHTQGPPTHFGPRPARTPNLRTGLIEPGIRGVLPPVIRAIAPAPRQASLIAVAERGPAIRTEVIVPTATLVARARDRSPELAVRLPLGPGLTAVALPASASAPRLTSTVAVRISTAGLPEPGTGRPETAGTEVAGIGVGRFMATTAGAGRPMPFGFSAARAVAVRAQASAAPALRELTVAREAQLEVRQADTAERVEEPQAIPAQQALPTEPTAPTTVSDGHTGTSSSACLAAISLLFSLGLGLRLTLSGGLRPPDLTYAPPVPPG